MTTIPQDAFRDFVSLGNNCAHSQLASVWSWNDLFQSGIARIGGNVRARISAANALSCSSPHGTSSLLALFDAERLSRRIFEIGELLGRCIWDRTF